MPKATQLNVKLENKVGSLAGLCRDLASRGINLLALSAPDIRAKRSSRSPQSAANSGPMN